MAEHALALLLYFAKRLDRALEQQRARHWDDYSSSLLDGRTLAVVGLAHRAKHYPRTLSGGEQQRVGIARGIVTDPTLLLCDEPTGDLDRKSGDEILDLLQALNREHGKTIIMVTHDPSLAQQYAHRTITMLDGAVVAA